MTDREQRLADLRREIASPRPAHLSEAFHATHIAAAQASLDRLLEMRPCMYCGSMSDKPPSSCVGCGRNLTLVFDSNTTWQELGAAMAANGFVCTTWVLDTDTDTDTETHRGTDEDQH